MLNQIVLVGRLTSDPQINEVEDMKVAYITLAIPRSYKNENGEYETDLVPITLFKGVAENITEYCKKGDLIGIKGRIQAFDNTIEVIAERVTFLSSNKKED